MDVVKRAIDGLRGAGRVVAWVAGDLARSIPAAAVNVFFESSASEPSFGGAETDTFGGGLGARRSGCRGTSPSPCFGSGFGESGGRA